MPNDTLTPVADPQRNRAAAAVLSLIAALTVGGVWILWPHGDPMHVTAGFNATPDAEPNLCWEGPNRCILDPQTFGFFFPEYDGGTKLAFVTSCFYEDPRCTAIGEQDAGVWIDGVDICATEGQMLPGGCEWSPADERVRPFVPGEPVFQAWVLGHPDAPWRCACGAPNVGASVDAGACEKLVDGSWVPATSADMSLKPGEWRGCSPMPCTTWGENVIPPQCCTDEFVGIECAPAGKCGNSKACSATDDAGVELMCFGQRCVPVPCPDAGAPDAG